MRVEQPYLSAPRPGTQYLEPHAGGTTRIQLQLKRHTPGTPCGWNNPNRTRRSGEPGAWNPMRVEQPLGHMGRLGQQYETIRIVNLHYEGTAEVAI